MLWRNTLSAALLCGLAATALPTSAQTDAAGSSSATTSRVAQNQQNPAQVHQTPEPSEPVAAPQMGVSTGAATTQAGATKVHGTITDPDGYPIPGATVTLTPSKGNAQHVTSGQDGSYSLDVTPGTYTLLVTMKGFSSYSVTSLKIPAVPGLSLDAKLSVGQETQVVNVEANSVQVSVDQDSNASSTVLSGKDLEALSDDPDELQSELTALAGPSAGPNGGQIYVDGFTGGELPPKSSIREIRINQNPFSAEYDRLGYGRVEIFTKPGTDKLHGSFQTNGTASQFDAGAPPRYSSTTNQPPFHTLFMFGSLSGPLSKSASYNVGGSYRDIESDAYSNGTIFAQPGSTTPCLPGTAGYPAGCVESPFQLFTYQPRTRTDIAPRLDLQLGENNVLTTRFHWRQNSETNQGVGGFALPSLATNDTSTGEELQMSDSQTYGSHVINETRFEYERSRTTTTPLSTAPYVNVQGNFSYGGANAQASSDHADHWEVQNYTSIQTKKNFIRLGGRLRIDREAQNTTANTNGAFTYSSIAQYEAGNAPNQFQRTVVNNHDIHVTFADLGLYAESDWKPLPNLTVSYGVRYETQNHLQEHHDWAPRVSFAYGLGSASKAPKTVLRGGFGIFYDRFSQGSIMNLEQNNGLNTTVYTLIQNNVPAGCSPGNIDQCSGGAVTGQTIYSVPTGSGHMQHIEAPYIEQAAIGVDQQLGHFGTLSANYIHSLGVHELALQNINCLLPDGSSPLLGNCYNNTQVNNQYLSEGQFHENQLVLNPKIQTTRWLSLFGYYSLSYAAGDNSGASTFLSQPGNIHADLGRTSFDTRSRYFMAGSITLPHFVQVSPFMIGQSGSPFNVTEGQDLNKDGQYNDRPYLLPAGTSAAQLNQQAEQLSGNPNLVVAKSIAGCGTFMTRAYDTTYPSLKPAGATLSPVNPCKGPSLFTLNLRVTKTWGFGGSRMANTGQGGNQKGGGPGGPGPGEHGHHGGGGGRGGGGGFFGGGGSSTGQRYNFSVGVMLQNVFANNDLSTPVGVFTSPDFGQSLQLAGFPYAQSNARFRMSLQASFSF